MPAVDSGGVGGSLDSALAGGTGGNWIGWAGDCWKRVRLNKKHFQFTSMFEEGRVRVIMIP